MADALSWASLGATVGLATFTVWFQVFQHRRQLVPRLKVYARGVSLMDGENGGVSIRHGFEIKVVNVGLRQAEVSQIHIDNKSIGHYWLADAYGWINLRLAPGESKTWTEGLDGHYRKHKERMEEEGKRGPLIVRGIATTAENRVFVSPWQRMNHIDGYPSMWRLRWGNRWRRFSSMFQRKPRITN